jgi:lysozyme
MKIVFVFTLLLVFLAVNAQNRINNRGLALVKEFEGLKLCKYKDPVGIWTICWGHTRTAQQFNCVTQAKCNYY